MVFVKKHDSSWMDYHIAYNFRRWIIICNLDIYFPIPGEPAERPDQAYRQTAPRAPADARSRLPSVLLPLDEQPSHSGDPSSLHHTSVGHLPRGVRWICYIPAVRLRSIPTPLEREVAARKRLPRPDAASAECANSELDRFKHKHVGG
jgi:hypothetical protein